MKKFAAAAVALGATSTAALAGGLDRSGTPVDILFAEGNRAELTFSFTSPSISGVDFLGNGTGNVADTFENYGAAFKGDLTEKLSLAIIYDEPYGADIRYNGDPAASLLGGTRADADSSAITALVRYKFTDRFSIYGGPRFVEASGGITLNGLAFAAAGLNGFNFEFSDASGIGGVFGAAYEIPDIALRASLTYHTPVDLELGTTIFPSGGGVLPIPDTETELPQSIELSVQSGIAENTLLFGSFRWSDYSEFSLDPLGPVPNLAQFEDVFTYEIGVGRRFTDKFSGSLAFIYEEAGDNLVSPLGPTSGFFAIAVGAKYDVNESFDISGGVRYTFLNDSFAEVGTPDTPVAEFENNEAISVGVRLGYNF